MDADELLKTRLESQITWYDRKSASNKTANTWTKIVEIVGAAVIPFLAGYAQSGATWISILIGILGIVVAVTAATSALLKFQEQWLKYRTTAESLKKEKYLFGTRVEPYDGADALSVLVQRVETLISQENTNWAQYMMKPTKADKAGD